MIAEISQDFVEDIKKWVLEQMNAIGAKKAVVGISGGKDSAVVATLMSSALGKENVYGVLMPDGEQDDIDFARDLVKELGIPSQELSIAPMTRAFYEVLNQVDDSWFTEPSRQTKLNLSPRVRMSLLYAIAQSLNAVVVNTSNLSEDWVGYATIYGDTAGAFSPLGQLTTEEVIGLGLALGMKERFVLKPPSDGLTGKTDEDVLGFTYEVLNRYIREGVTPTPEIKDHIDKLNRQSRFKFLPIPMYPAAFEIKAEDTAGIYKK